MVDINFIDILDNFHFIRPLFLLAIIPLLIILYLLRKQVRSQSGWQGILASHLYDNLVSTESGNKSSPPWSLLFAGWLLICLALAGPTWEKLPQPVYQVNKGKVILMDMSMSLRAEDIKPNRLSRVRFKAMDLLDVMQEGETGMVAYAGDAFVISPLTSDVQNLEALIPSLSPEIMPVQGSDALFALETTFELLKNAGYNTGDVFWITDGIDMTEVAPIRNLMSDHDYRINILAVGTEDGAPIKITNGNFLKDRTGAVVIPKLRTSTLSTIARSSGGRFVLSRPDDADINYLSEPRIEPEDAEETESDDSFGDQWKEFGPWLLLLLLPVASYSFRRGVLPIVLVVIVLDAQTPVYADDSQTWWNNLWQTEDQQGAKSFGNKDFQSAAQQFQDPMWKGLSHFNAGEFEQAAEIYSTMDSPEGNFSLGNALAQNQQYQEALAAYERTLELDPDFPNAAENKKHLEDLMQEQQQDSENSENSENSDDSEQDDSEQEDSEQEQQQQQDSQQEDSEQEQQQQQDSQQDDSQQDDSQQEQQDSNSEQNESEQDSQQEQQEAEQQESEESDAEQQDQQQGQMPEEELTDEQKEQLQKIEKWLRKVPEDPAYLLKRKMLLEQQRRQRQRLPASDQKNW